MVKPSRGLTNALMAAAPRLLVRKIIDEEKSTFRPSPRTRWPIRVGLPHSGQNLAPDGTAAPHDGQ